MRSLTPLLTLALICGTFWLWFTQMDGSTWQLHHSIGVAIIAPSWLLWARSRYDLGASFTGRAEARALVTRGIYSRIRHPIYLFGLCVCAGLFVFLGRPLLWLILVVAIPMQVVRARTEERVLEAAFGAEYQAYKKHAWF
jgi:protein-S-isoprenylcysteine O-methyltransferase Ste14